MSDASFPTLPVDQLSLRALLQERAMLFDKLFGFGVLGQWTRADEVRLVWVRWQLDRIEAARLEATSA